MSCIRLLDCTLRDGGYCNEWMFGKDNIKYIVDGLVDANIDIIECGYISQNEKVDYNKTRYASFEQMTRFIPKNKNGKLFVVMINYGEFDIDKIPKCDGSSVDGIRIAFHKNDMEKAIAFCKNVKEKGYKVFVQGMVTISYTDEEFLNLINKVNEIAPYAFYIVDSFGMMKGKDLIRFFYTVEHNLLPGIFVGFHSHNNLQLAYSNCLALTQVQSNRSIIIDSSIYGMGRGAGNLNTELFIEYLNETNNSNYRLKPILSIIDKILNNFYEKNRWGYSLPNYISAKNNAHPAYASFLDDKKTLTIEDMDNIFKMIDSDRKVRFDKKYIEEVYITYLDRDRVQEEHKKELMNILRGKKILLVAPGKSSMVESEKIVEYSKDAVCISVNFNYSIADYIFVSNIRRYRELDESLYKKCIITSNVDSNIAYIQTKYSDLINDTEMVMDNAGLMAIKYLMGFDVKEIALAGFDGYSHDIMENYADPRMEIITKNPILDAMNSGMSLVMKKYSKSTKIFFLTTPKHVAI